MTPGMISLLFGVHAHQPVGNFASVIDDAHERCYRPFLQTMLRYPEFRFAAHFSGWLLGDLLERFPADMEMLATMVRRGQVELFGAGDCEPVLAAIPARDRAAQLEALSARLERAFGVRPRGAWLTERVWEPTVVSSLTGAGIRYVVVDDYHFLCTGRGVDELDGYFATEEDGVALDVFPISEQLRYRLPFAPADESVAWLEALARDGRAGAIYFDDIEKFGIWPETYEWVYNKGWLARFVESVLASPVITTDTFEGFHARHRSRGVVYLPTTSYIEMNEWTLPVAAARGFGELAQRERDAGRYETSKAFVRGGIWRNFFSRYPESNWMHKRMLGVSGRLAALGHAHPDADSLRATLHRAQANDAYWHGLFGGLYLPHLRRSVWHELITLESALDRAGAPAASDAGDVDLDGRTEHFLASGALLAVVRDDGHACVHEFDARAVGQNFADTLARRPEAYHRRIGEAADHAHAAGGEGIASAHDRVDFKHEILPEDLEADARPRAVALDAIEGRAGAARVELDAYRLLARDGASIEFEHALGAGRIVKRVSVDGPTLAFEWRLAGLAGRRLRTRLNLAMPSCDGYSGRYVLDDGSIPCGFGQPLALARAARLTLEDGAIGAGVRVACVPPAAVACAPYHTVSLSEAGFEKIMQAAVVDLAFDVGADDATVRVELGVVA